jgi:hypothetical protein
MGIFKFLFDNKTPSEKTKTDVEHLIEDYESLKSETERLQKENNAWQIDFDKIIALRQKAKELEQQNKTEEAISVYLQSIAFGEFSPKLNICNYAHDINRVIILYSRIKEHETLKRFIQDKINLYPDFQDAKNWAVRLSKLNSDMTIKSIPDKQIEIKPKKSGELTLGQKLDDFKKNMPEFNFYYDLPTGQDTMTYNHKVPFEFFSKLRELKDAFETIKSLAKIAENEGDYSKAIEAYERLIIEEYENSEPYERLIVIYSKLKLKDKEKETLNRAIAFFTELKEKQKDYVLKLAEKYKMRDKALEYINDDKKIYYYGGAFELYNPQTSRLKKWNDRLQKIR